MSVVAADAQGLQVSGQGMISKLFTTHRQICMLHDLSAVVKGLKLLGDR